MVPQVASLLKGGAKHTPEPTDPPPHERPYLTISELAEFDRMLSRREITMFRVGECEICKRQIPKSKTLCSRSCLERKKRREEDDGEER